MLCHCTRQPDVPVLHHRGAHPTEHVQDLGRHAPVFSHRASKSEDEPDASASQRTSKCFRDARGTDPHLSVSKERTINHAAGSHGVSGIFVKYDTSSLTVTVSEQHMPLWQFLVRLCGIIGGIFSTTGRCCFKQQTRASRPHDAMCDCVVSWRDAPRAGRLLLTRHLLSLQTGSVQAQAGEAPSARTAFQHCHMSMLHVY